MLPDIKIPQDIEAEKTVLGTILFNNEVFNKIIEIISEPDAFYNIKHKLIYSAIINLNKNNSPISPTSVANMLGQDLIKAGNNSYLWNLESFRETSSSRCGYFADIVYEKYQKRQAIKVLEQALDSCRNGAELVDAVGSAQKSLSRIIAPDDKEMSSIGEMMPDAIQRVIDGESKKKEYVYSGFVDIDKAIGGYEKGELIIVGGYPSHGKTTFALQNAYHVASTQNLPVGIISYEMSKAQLTMRYLCVLAKVDYAQVKQGTLSDDEMRRINNAERILTPLPIKMYYNPKLNINQIIPIMERYKREMGIGFWIIDYLQLIPSSIKERRLQIEEISRTLKLASGIIQSPIMALSQLSRAQGDGHPKLPTLSKLRESGSIEQDGDIVEFVYRNEKNESVVDIAKNRMGKTRTVPMMFIEGTWASQSQKEDDYGRF